MSQQYPPDPSEFNQGISTEAKPLAARDEETIHSDHLRAVFKIVELLEKNEELDPEYQKLVDENFWDLV